MGPPGSLGVSLESIGVLVVPAGGVRRWWSGGVVGVWAGLLLVLCGGWSGETRFGRASRSR